MTDDERAALVDEIGRRVAYEGCPDLSYPCWTDDFRFEHCHCKYVARNILAAIEPAIRADERARLAERLKQRALKFRLKHKRDTRDYVGQVALSRCADVLEEEAAAIRALKKDTP